MDDDLRVDTGSPAWTRNVPELLVDYDTADDFGQRVRLRADQLLVLVAAILSGVPDPIVPSPDLF